MARYRRSRTKGGSYFFTVALADRSSDFLTANVDVIRAAYCATQKAAPFHCSAFVLLPDHIYAVCTLPQDDDDFSIRWARFKTYVSRRKPPSRTRSSSKVAKREKGLWQRRFWEHAIRDETDYFRHVAYCWGNPVKHRLVATPLEWPFSSFHRDVKRGVVSSDWTGEVDASVKGNSQIPVGRASAYSARLMGSKNSVG